MHRNRTFERFQGDRQSKIENLLTSSLIGADKVKVFAVETKTELLNDLT